MNITKTLLLSLTLALSMMVNAQTVIENPKVGMSTNSGLTINRIELNDTATILSFYLVNKPNSVVNIPLKTYIIPVGTKDTLHVVSAKGIPLAQRYVTPESGRIDYKLIFPKIELSVSMIDYGEPGDDPSLIYDIQLKPLLFKSIIPEKFIGNWFRTDNAQWEISLMDSSAIYKSKIWKYAGYREKEGLSILKLKNGLNYLSLYVSTGEKGTCKIGETPSNLWNYKSECDKSQIPVDKEELKLPIFKRDTAIYCGYYKNFNSRYPNKTGMVYVNDVLVGEYVPYSFIISADGYFEVKIPHSNPQVVYVTKPFNGYETIFIEPGRRIFQFIDCSNTAKDKTLFMGEGSKINADLSQMKDILGFDGGEILRKAINLTPEQRKLYFENNLQNDLNKLKEFSQSHRISNRAEKLNKFSIG